MKPVRTAVPRSREARAALAWIEGTNPLRGMTAQRAQALRKPGRRQGSLGRHDPARV
jgi:hypothetical protein